MEMINSLLYSVKFQQHSVQSNLSKQNILSVRDAFSQTSDIETKKYEAQESYHHHSHENFESMPQSHHSKESNSTEVILLKPFQLTFYFK